MKHCDLKAIYLLTYQVNPSVYKMIENNKKQRNIDGRFLFCPNLVWALIRTRSLISSENIPSEM